MNVYFISGLCANCHVFDNIRLPMGCEKKYIEWLIPEGDENLEHYTHRMAASIDINKPFALVGYSFGGIVVQEMNRFLKPELNIIISSIKQEDEIPRLFAIAQRVGFASNFPENLIPENRTFYNTFARMIYDIRKEDASRYITVTAPHYLRWSIKQITEWKPTFNCPNLHHIHGDSDYVFPYKLVHNVLTVEGGDHLMIVKKWKIVSVLVNQLLVEYQEAHKPKGSAFSRFIKKIFGRK